MNAPLKPLCSSSNVLHVQAAGQMTSCELVVVVFKQIPTFSLNIITKPPAPPYSLYIKSSSLGATEVADAGSWPFPYINSTSFSSLWTSWLAQQWVQFSDTVWSAVITDLVFQACLDYHTCPQPQKYKVKTWLHPPAPRRGIYFYMCEAVWARIGWCFPRVPSQMLSLDFRKSVLKPCS